MAALDRAFLGRGWAFPLATGADGEIAQAEYEEDVHEAVRLVLGTDPGERVMRPDFGSGLHALVFEPLTATTQALVKHRVEEALVRWEPRIDVLNVRRSRQAGPRRRRARRGRLPRPLDEHVLQPRLPLLPRRGEAVVVSAPVLEPRSAEQLAAALRARLPAFTPDWRPLPGGPGDALLEIYAQFLRALGERIDAAPDKNELAFLDLLGLDVLPAQAARAAVVFATIPGGGDGRAPAGTRLGAKGPDPSVQLVFETERAVGLAQARLAEVVTFWPGRDEYADHSADAIGGRPFTLWDGLQPVAHELYLASDRHFALAGVSSVALNLDLAPGGSEALDLEWSWWDGDRWRGFKEMHDRDDPGWSLDGTTGLTRSGTIRLTTDCGASQQRVVGGWKAHWLRARTTKPLPPDPSRRLAQVDRIWLQTVIDRRLEGESCRNGLLPDTAYAGGEKLDTTKPFFPLGRAPSPDVAFYVSCEEAFSRPGAQVEICLDRPETEQERIDSDAAQYALDVTSAVTHILDSARAGSLVIQKITDAIIGMAPPNDSGAGTANGKKSALASATSALSDMSGLDAVATAAKELADSLPAISITIPDLVETVVDEAKTQKRIEDAAAEAALAVGFAAADVASWGQAFGKMAAAAGACALGGPIGVGALMSLNELAETVIAANALLHAANVILKLGDDPLSGPITSLKSTIDSGDPTKVGDLSSGAGAIVTSLAHYSVGVVTKQVNVADAATLTAGRRTAKDRGVEGGASEHEALADLAMLSPLEAAAAAGKLPPELTKAVLAWEYWNGDGWSTFTDFHGGGEANLRGSGRFTFDVPPDWETCKVNGTDGHWLRARIVYGVFGKLTLVSWKDEDHQVHFMPIIEPRPPQLDAFRIGYLWKSKPSAPDHALTLDDFAWEDHTEDAAWRGGTFAPFRPVADATPALYLGFDGPLPADELGILFDVEEVVGDESGPALSWERWDGAAWRGLAVEDETGALAVPGIVHVPWPGDERPAPAQVTAAAGQTVTLADARAAARFTTGDLTWIGTDSGGELVRVAGVSGTNVGTVAPLAAAYGAATLARASLPRFGTPRTWLRARLRSDGDPRLGVVRGVYPNATWAAQVETLTGELLGTSNGEPSQSFFLTRTPALAGEVIEVRELDGGRANVEYPLLVDALRATGIREQDLTVVHDSQTGHVTEVWVPWRGRPNLAFSGPGDRDYTIERTHGRILFGDGIHGRIPPAAVDGIRARSYRSGGGEAGNVPAAAIAQVLSGVVVAGVTNPRAAEGGAGSEPDAEVLARGPLTVRHRRQAVTAADYEALAFDASPAVAVARAATRRGCGDRDDRPAQSRPSAGAVVRAAAGGAHVPAGACACRSRDARGRAARLLPGRCRRDRGAAAPGRRRPRRRGGAGGARASSCIRSPAVPAAPAGRSAATSTSPTSRRCSRRSTASTTSRSSRSSSTARPRARASRSRATGSSPPACSTSASEEISSAPAAAESRHAPLRGSRRRRARARPPLRARVDRPQRERSRDHARRAARVARRAGHLPRQSRSRAAPAQVPHARRRRAGAAARRARRARTLGCRRGRRSRRDGLLRRRRAVLVAASGARRRDCSRRRAVVGRQRLRRCDGALARGARPAGLGRGSERSRR